MQARLRYILIDPLCWQEIDGEWLALGSATGALQRLDALSAAVLATVEEAPGTASEVAERIAVATEVALTPELSERIDTILDGLQRTGFLECRPQ